MKHYFLKLKRKTIILIRKIRIKIESFLNMERVSDRMITSKMKEDHIRPRISRVVIVVKFSIQRSFVDQKLFQDT